MRLPTLHFPGDNLFYRRYRLAASWLDTLISYYVRKIIIVNIASSNHFQLAFNTLQDARLVHKCC